MESQFIRIRIWRILISDMALPFEKLNPAEQAREQADRIRRRDLWPRTDDEEQLRYSQAVQQDHVREVLEVALVSEEDGKLERLQTAVREALRGLTELRKQTGLAVKYGPRIAVKMFESDGTEELTDDERKRLHAILKESGGRS